MAAALPRMEEALRIWRDLGETAEVGLTIEAIGWARFMGGDDAGARATFEECLRVQGETGDPILVNRARVGLAQALSGLHEVTRVRPMAREIIAFSASIHDARGEHLGWHFLADAALIEGSCEESLGLYQKSLALARAIDDRIEISFEILGVAMSLAGLGQPAAALRLAGAARAEWDRAGADIHVRFWDELMERYFGRARADLGQAADAEWERGSGIPFDDAVTSALAASAVSS